MRQLLLTQWERPRRGIGRFKYFNANLSIALSIAGCLPNMVRFLLRKTASTLCQQVALTAFGSKAVIKFHHVLSRVSSIGLFPHRRRSAPVAVEACIQLHIMAFRAPSVALFRLGHCSRSRVLFSTRGFATVSGNSRYAFDTDTSLHSHGRCADMISIVHTMLPLLEAVMPAARPLLRPQDRVLEPH